MSPLRGFQTLGQALRKLMESSFLKKKIFKCQNLSEDLDLS